MIGLRTRNRFPGEGRGPVLLRSLLWAPAFAGEGLDQVLGRAVGALSSEAAKSVGRKVGRFPGAGRGPAFLGSPLWAPAFAGEARVRKEVAHG